MCSENNDLWLFEVNRLNAIVCHWTLKLVIEIEFQQIFEIRERNVWASANTTM